MPKRLTPGCLVRSTLAIFGIIFLPFAIWFLYHDWQRNLVQALVLVLVSIWFLRLAYDRSDESPLSAIDDLKGGGKE